MEIPSDGQEPEEHDGAPENAAYRRLSSLRDDLQESTGDLKGNDIPSFNRELSFLQALCSADTSRRVGTKERIRATDGQLEQIRAQGAALRLLLHDVLVPDWLLAKCSGEDLSTGDRPADHDESLYSLARFGRNISSHALREMRDRKVYHALQRHWAEKTSAAHDERLPDHVRQMAAMDARAVRLHRLQQQTRRDVFAERRAIDLCHPESLLDWSGWRREQKGSLNLELFPAYEQVRSVQERQMYTERRKDYHEAAKARETRMKRSEDSLRSLAHEARKESGRPEKENARFHGLEKAKQKVISQRRQFLSEVLKHGHQFRRLSWTAAKQRKTLTDTANAYHNKRKQQLLREQRERIAALKAEDEESYYQLVKDAKNQRVHTVLEKTNELLTHLGTRIKQQKRAASLSSGIEGIFDEDEAMGEEGNHETNQAHENGSKDILAGKRRYEALIKEFDESVKKQSNLLRGPDGRGELRPYQLAGLNWMVSLHNNHLNGILADEMGLGKTIQTIALLAHLMEFKGENGPHLIVAPKAVLPNWKSEFDEWIDQSIMKVVVYDGRGDERKQLRDEKIHRGRFNVLLTHYDIVMRDKNVLNKIHWEYLIVDEGHRLKNHESKLSELLNSQFKSRFRLLLTGTPIQNNLTELWSLLNFLLPKIFNSSESFKEWFNKPFAGAKEDMDLTEEEELLLISRLHQVIRPFLLRRKKAEVEQELPDKVELTLKCEMSAWQKRFYRQIVQSASVNLGERKARGLHNTAMQLRKICNHPYLFIDDNLYEEHAEEELIRASGKFELLDRVLPKLKAAGHRVLLFSQMTQCMDILEDFLEHRGYKYVRLDGGTKTDERSELLSRFNEEGSDVFVFLLSTRAGGLGLNLQGADTVIMFESDWNPQMDQQAEDRAHRIGQQKQVRVVVFVTVNSIEEKILEAAKEKRGIDQKVIQAGMFNNQSTAQQRNQVLKDVLERGAGQLEGERSDVPDDEEINRLIARNQSEFELYQRIDQSLSRQRMRNLPRLLTEEELPEWVKKDPEEKGGEDEGAAGQVDDGPVGPRRKLRRQNSYYAETGDDEVEEVAVESDDENEGALTRAGRKRNSSRLANLEQPRKRARRDFHEG